MPVIERNNDVTSRWFPISRNFAIAASAALLLMANAPVQAAASEDELDAQADQEAQGGLFSRDGLDTKQVADPQFRALFLAWKRLDAGHQTTLASAVPSVPPVTEMKLTSSFGYRSDPFRGRRAMHQGLDIPGAIGTPIYATADGYVGRAGRYGGYGNLIELEHGNGVQTRYGHLSAIMVQPGSRVSRGDIIGRMGSTGRSTGSHLHYEVRLDGEAVDPMPYVQSGAMVTQIAERANDRKIALGGPAGQ